MFTLILKRTLRGCLTLVIVTVLVFVLLRVLPGDAATMLTGSDATEEQVQEMRELWGLDKSMGEQFIIYVQKLLTGDAGQSYQYTTNGVPLYDASELVLMRVPYTLLLGCVALIISLIISIPLGVLCALKPNSWIDNLVSSINFIIQSFPVFFIGILLVYTFALRLNWLPTGGTGGLKYIWLPAFTLSAHTTAQLTRVTRTEVSRVMQSDFIRTSKSKGLSNYVVLFKHGLRNAMIPLITVIGLRLGSLLHGAVICETLFRWPGLGNLLITSLNARDYPVVQILVPYTAFLFILMNIIVDILYGVFDPRIRQR